jgi:glycosyltransferase involved in cell wall biosynthesis
MSLSRQKPRLLFLYSELADYFLACIKKLTSVYDVEVHVIHWPVNSEAPFSFVFPDGVRFYNRKQFDLKRLQEKVKDICPDFIYCSGWMDKDYLSAVQGYKDKIPVVIGLDTKWKSTLRQYIACALSRITLQKIFSHCWVPGQKQMEYASKLGFKRDKIETGYYSADTDYFTALAEKIKDTRQKKYPRRLIYVGRYYEFKGIQDLWEAFIQWQKDSDNDWELWCLGTGDIEPIVHPKIKHFGFIQPKDMAPFLMETSVFIMPSHFEPWGVVLHEFAAAGFPLICSDEVGSTEAFLREGENGYIYRTGDISKLKECLVKIAALPASELVKMGNKSKELALSITPEKWANTVMSILGNK